MIREIIDGFNKIRSYTANLGSYLLNDPTTPDLSAIMPTPPNGILKFSVNDMSDKPSTAAQKRAANCNVVIGNCINNVQIHAKSPIKTWASTSNLIVQPAAGQEMNAYYDRRSLRFFYYPYNGRNVYFADSADIVTHELGHAILDSMRPDFWSVQALEIWSFHEAFSDIVAMFNLMNYDKAILATLMQTSGDLKKSNVISRLAEEVGLMIRGVTKDPSYLPNALRDPAMEHFKYVDPSMLPEEAPNNALAAECHSFGRVFSNAWYAIFVKLFEHHSKNMSPILAFKTARDASFSMIMHAVPASPRVSNYYSAVAKSMVVVARSRSKEYGDIVSSVFTEWNILKPADLKIQSSPQLKSKIISRLSSKDSVLRTSKSTLVCLRERKTMEVKDLSIAMSMSFGEDVKIEVPYDTYYEFDHRGRLLDAIVPDEETIKKHVANCILSISSDIGPKKMWDISGGILKRRFVQ